MIAKRFNNGNINLKLEKEDFENNESTLVKVVWALFDLDCDFFGEEYCLSNYDMAQDMYSSYSDKILRIVYSTLSDLETGKTVKIYARTPDKYEREQLNEMEEN